MNKSIIVCSIVRNAGTCLRHNLPVMEALSREFYDFKMVIFENDSVDDTKEVLKHWQKVFGDKLEVISEDTMAGNTIPKPSEVSCNPFYSARRIGKMVNLRNQYMDYVEKMSADFLMVVDLDIAGFSLDGILSSFNLGIQWDAVCANCWSLSPRLKRRYHDTYALVEYGDEQNPQTEKKILSLSDKFASIRPGDSPVRVFSAFGGITIYRFEAVRGLRYKLLQNEDERVEVRCEHFSLYRQMADKGYDKVYINPSMKVKYQNLTLKIILHSIKRIMKF